jgi:hypothetical protein
MLLMPNIDAVLSTAEIEKLRQLALRAISPIKPLAKSANLGGLLWNSKRTNAGRNLPHYYLVYFLLVDLLGFPDLGQEEKVAWSVPIEFEGKPFLIAHRKLGAGIFCIDSDKHETRAGQIVSLITKGVRTADPFFRSLARQAIRQSKINVRNNSAELFSRYEYLRDQFRKLLGEAQLRKNEVRTETRTDDSTTSTSYQFPALRLSQEAQWLGIAAVDAFFAWTEHVFIHLAILQQRVTTGDEVTQLAGAEWQEKFKRVLDLSDGNSKKFYDSLVLLRRQVRNYMAHGSFGKQGEAFDFHSSAGAVPVILDYRSGEARLSLIGETPFEEGDAISTIEDFIAHLWSGQRHTAWLYIQDACLPVILTFASDGTYEDAMQSEDDMEQFIYGLTRQMDDAANMDW